jgi:hypothetical protein
MNDSKFRISGEIKINYIGRISGTIRFGIIELTVSKREL